MTEAEWLEGEDWGPLVAFLSGRLTRRTATLYVCGGLRQLWHLLYDELSRRAVEVWERAADGSATQEEVDWAGYDAESPTFGYEFETHSVGDWFARDGRHCESVLALMRMGVYREEDLRGGGYYLGDERVRARLHNAAKIAYYCPSAYQDGRWYDYLLKYLAEQEEWPGGWLVRDIFGNPFRPVSIDAAWYTTTVVRLAQAIYDERTFERLPILADALEEAGCDDLDILTHLRGPGPHVRGRWAVDLILGKG
jgi:hypothetical protein